ncbi:class I tRNA ligase family protein, partial [Marine Group I thaumarchaeote]|nr:class I tRNA ligase family protein [Marine Group I thaumarchaeote]
FFEYVFTGKGIGNVNNIPVKKLKELRKSFDYWYPLDYNISAVELVPNHMTFSIFHHVVLFPKSKWIKGEIGLGMGNLNGKKMSASKGHVIIVTDITEELGADLVRLFLMNFVEPWQDFDWNTKTVTQMSKTLKNKLAEILDLAKEAKSGKLENLTSFDKWILSRTNTIVKEVTLLMDKFLLRKSIQILFFEFLKDLKYYTVLNPHVLHYILSRWAIMMSPFIPHFSEELGEKLGTGLIVNSDWPKVEKKYIDETAEALKESSDLLEKDIQKVIGLSGIKTPKVAIIIIADEWKYSLFKEANKIKEETKTKPR